MPHDYETPQILHDAPLRRDDQHHFHFDEFAVTLCRLIADKRTRTPLAIGVSGSWGSGKTTLLQRVKQKLDEAGNLSDATRRAYWGDNESPQQVFRPCKTVWFDAWKYADEDELLVALIRVILATMAQGNLGDKFWSKVLDKNAPRYNVIATLLSFFKFKVGTNFEVSFDLEKYQAETPFAKNTAFFDYFDAALEELIARWVHDTGEYRRIDEKTGALVIFVDDLDRCLPEKTVQVLEAIKLFLDKHGCVFVLGADLNVVRSAVETHYKNTRITGETASDYLEKIIQLRFELPPIVDAQMNEYLAAEGKTALDEETRQNWRLVMIGAEINPRKVKTFFNDLNLQWAMLKNTGQARDVNRDDFTRWQVLMRVAPDNFREVVYGFPDDAIDLRHKFILDALKWAQGETSLDATFQDYAKSQRLRRVLREIKAFGQTFDPKTLDAFVHLTAPPPPPAPTPVEAKPAVVPPLAVEVKEEVVAAERLEVREPLRGEAKAPAANVQTWGGMEFVRIPAGKFLMGSKDDNKLASDDEKPQHTVEIPYDYWLARYPVTNEQFARFVEGAAYKFSLAKNWTKKANHPVVDVSWRDAKAYCKWLNDVLHSKIKDLIVRLPTEAEWEKAARGEYGNEWPWGNEFDKDKCNSAEGKKGGTTPVGAYSPQGDSPYGVADMAGNVWEWCHSLYQPYPYKMDDGRESEEGAEARVLRGGSFDHDRRGVRCASRIGNHPDLRNVDFGFRVVVSPGF
jgi:formylglycine-generating enzyme required for sulfatase activity